MKNSKVNFKIVLILVAFIFGQAEPAKILFYFGVASYSHKILVWPLVEELANKGHEITVMSPYQHKVPNPKIHEFNPDSIEKCFANEQDDILNNRYAGTQATNWDDLPEFGLIICEIMLKDPQIKQWIKTAELDLVIIDALFNECGYGIAHKLNAKTILFGTSTLAMWMPDIFGHSPESSWIPDLQYFYEEPMSFMEKVYTTIAPIYWHFWVRQFNYFPKLEAIIREELDLPDLPSIQELERNTSLVFLNTHFSSEYARSLPPVYVPVGGLHIVGSDKHVMPKGMGKFIDESEANGVVYVSFGTYAKASAFPPEVKSVLYQVFASFKSTRFIWTCDLDRPKELSDNVMIVSWAPQQEILGHKKVRGFITHGGLLSISEAAYYGVPLIVFPLFADQDYNANLVERSGRGLKLEITRVTKEELHGALSQILNTDRFRRKMTEVSKLFKDRPTKALDTAVWWTEYVLRHKYTSSLKPLSMHQTWYERRLLDVWLFLLLAALFSFITVFCVIWKRFSPKRRDNSSVSVKQSKKPKRA